MSELSPRTANILVRSRLTLAEAQQQSDAQLLALRNLGRKTLREIREATLPLPLPPVNVADHVCPTCMGAGRIALPTDLRQFLEVFLEDDQESIEIILDRYGGHPKPISQCAAERGLTRMRWQGAWGRVTQRLRSRMTPAAARWVGARWPGLYEAAYLGWVVRDPFAQD